LPAVRVFALLALLVLTSAAHPAPANADGGFQRGFVLTGDRSDSYLSPRSDAMLQKMADDGADHVAIFTQWFLPGPSASLLAPDPARTPSDASLLHAMAVAHRLGMEVTIKPQIGIPSAAWIGNAHPADLNTFWNGYRAMVLHYADLAQRGQASMLVLGTEMRTLSWDQARWRPLIADVRTRFHGALTYGANYDEFLRVPFWDALDYIGIDAYFPLADSANPAPTAAELAAAWQSRGYLAAIGDLSRRTGKKVLFTELGYRATRTTAARPSAWNVVDLTDTHAQAQAYEAFYDSVAPQPWMAGVYWWEVNPDRSWIQDYDPIGKPAEQVMAISNFRLTLSELLPWFDLSGTTLTP
jgi:hypothetical protein